MQRLRTWHLRAAVLLLAVVPYLPLWTNDFVKFDDEHYITANPQVLQGLSKAGLCWAWTTLHAGYWQPLSWLSLQLDAHCFATRSSEGLPFLSPEVVHGENLCWHTASALLLFGLWHRLTGARWPSFLVAALFAVHPLHVESVAWAAERKDVLSVFFGILTLWAYLRYVEQPGWQSYLVVAAVYLVSLLCKPMLATLPLVLLLLDYWPLRRFASPPPSPETPPVPARPPTSRRWLVLEKVPLFALAAAIGIVTLLVRQKTQAAVPFSILPLSARLANAAAAYGWYVSHSVCPVRLAVLYPHPLSDWSLAAALAGGGVLLTLTLLALRQASRRPWLLVGWLWFVVTLVPVIGLFQGGEQAWADRFTYWPHIGLFAALAWGLGDAVERIRFPGWACGLVGGLVLGCLGVLTWIQVGFWKDSVTLWEHALAITPRNGRAHGELGAYYLDLGRPDEAERHFAEAVRLWPASSAYHDGLGLSLLSLGKMAEASEHFLEAVRTDAGNVDALQNLGVARLRQGMPDSALACFRKVLEREPASAGALGGIGRALWRQGKRQEAIEAFQAAVGLNPREAEAWLGLGRAHLARGEGHEAVAALSRAVRLLPVRADVHSDLGMALLREGKTAQAVSCHGMAVQMLDELEARLAQLNGHLPPAEWVAPGVLFRCRLAFALNQAGDPWTAAGVYRAASRRDRHWPDEFTARAWDLLTDPEVDWRDAPLACELTSQAIQATGDPSASLLDAHAAAQAALGDFTEAARVAQQALEKALAGGEETLASAIRDRLQLYKEEKMVTGRSP